MGLKSGVYVNGDREKYGRCSCGWRGAAYAGPLAGIDAQDELEQHERQHPESLNSQEER